MRQLLILLFVISTFQLMAQQKRMPPLKVNNLSWTVQNGKYGLYNKYLQRFVIAPKYDKAGFYSEQVSMIRLNGKSGFVNNQGATLIKMQYDTTINFSPSLIIARKGDRFVLIQKEDLTAENLGFANMEVAEYGDYDNIIVSYSDDYAIAELNGKFGYLNGEGEEAIPLIFDAATLFDEDIAAVKVEDKWGAIHKTDSVLIDFSYKNMGAFENGMTIAQNKRGKFGIIDKEENQVVSFKYQYLTPLNESGFALAKKKKKYGLINSEGEIVIPFQYDFDENYSGIIQICEGYMWLKRGEKWGTVDYEGEIVIPFIYDELASTDGDEARVWFGDKMQVIDREGKCLQNCN